VIWRDWYTHDVVESTPGTPTTLAAPLGHINVHIRDGAALLLHAQPAYTIEGTRQGPYSLLVSQTAKGLAHGTAYVDDGISSPPGPSRVLTFSATKNAVSISGHGGFHIAQRLADITVLGVGAKPSSVSLNGQKVGIWTYAAQQGKLSAVGVDADLNSPVLLTWKWLGVDYWILTDREWMYPNLLSKFKSHCCRLVVLEIILV
jgi:alpha-glucosidase